MTAEEAIGGFQALSRHFRQGYKWGDLQPIWPDLLQCSPQALVRVVGILKKNGRQLPSPGYVLQQVQWWEMNLAPRIEVEKVREEKHTDPDAEGREALQLMKARINGEISQEEQVQRLYRMSEKYGQPGYAVQAQEAKGKISR